MKKFLSSGVSATALILAFSAFSATAALPQGTDSVTRMTTDKSYYIPHVYLSGYGGSNLLGNLDVLAPVYLMSDRNLYLYGAANYAGAEESDQDSSWSAIFGAGYRQMFNWTGTQRIYGGYLLGSYNYSSYGNDYWVINPGIESLGQRWDYRVNAYLPVSNHNFAYQDFASNHGDDSHVNAHDNETDDMLVTYYENVGYGLDAEFGGRLFSISHMPVKGYIDGYYYNVDNSDITYSDGNDPDNVYGIGARVTFQPTSYLSIEVKDTYDNDKANLFEVGAKIYFNGFRYGVTNTHVDDQDLQARLFDDIEHNFGTIDSAASSYVHQGNTDGSPYNPIVPIEDHQIFYSGDVTTGGDGTAENPYPASDLNQSSINDGYTSWDDAQFVLASGSASSYTPGNIEMYDGTSMVGKTADYTALATGSDLPTVYGALTLDGYNTIDSIILYNLNGGSSVGINVASGAQSVFINNSIIGTSSGSSNQQFETGIDAGSGSDVNINGSSIYAGEVGVNLVNATARVEDSKINVLYNPKNTKAATEEVTGIRMDQGGSLTVEGSTINVSIASDTSDSDSTFLAYGIHALPNNSSATAQNKSQINVVDSTITATSKITDSNNRGGAYGVLIGNDTNTTGGNAPVEYWQLNVNDSSISGNASGTLTSVMSSNDIYNSNGWGILIGYGYVNEVGNSDLSVHDNAMIISNDSNVSGSGSFVGLAGASGNGIGAAVGYGYVDLNLDSGNNSISNVDMSVSNNQISVIESDVTGTGSITGLKGTSSVYYSGLGFGLLVGYAGVDATPLSTSTAFNNDDFTINSNGINLSSSYITSDSTNDGAADTTYDSNSITNEQRLNLGAVSYGVLVGYGAIPSNTDVASLAYANFGAKNNSVSATSNEIDTYLNGSGMDSTVGIAVGNYYFGTLTVDAGNSVKYTKNTFNTSTASGVANYTQYSVGIYLPEGSATTETLDGNTYNRSGDGSNMTRYGWGILGSDRSMADMTTWTFIN